jgi:hypothetical protein
MAPRCALGPTLRRTGTTGRPGPNPPRAPTPEHADPPPTLGRSWTAATREVRKLGRRAVSYVYLGPGKIAFRAKTAGHQGGCRPALSNEQRLRSERLRAAAAPGQCALIGPPTPSLQRSSGLPAACRPRTTRHSSLRVVKHATFLRGRPAEVKATRARSTGRAPRSPLDQRHLSCRLLGSRCAAGLRPTATTPPIIITSAICKPENRRSLVKDPHPRSPPAALGVLGPPS